MEYSFGGDRPTDVNKGTFSKTNIMNRDEKKRKMAERQKKALGVGEAFIKNVPGSVISGAYQGSKIGGPAGTIVGGAIGLVTGLMGMSEEVTANQEQFMTMLDAQKQAKQREKLALAAQRESIRAAKRKNKDAGMFLPPAPIVEADKDIISAMSSGTSFYDQRLGNLYGYST